MMAGLAALARWEPGALTFRAEFARMVALTVLPLVVLAVALIAILTDRERTLVLGRLISVTQAAAAEVDRTFGQQIALLETLAGSRSLEDGRLHDFYIEAQRAVVTQPDWITIIVSDPSGQQLVNLARPYGATLPVFPDLVSHAKTVETRAPVIVAHPDRLGPLTNLPVIGLRVPVVRDDTVILVLSAALDPQWLAETLARLELPDGWGSGILDEDGTILECTACPEGTMGNTAQDVILTHLQMERTEVGTLLSFSGVESYFAVTRAPISGWAVTARVPVSLVTRLWINELWVIAVGAAASVVVALGSLALIINRRRSDRAVLASEVSRRTRELQSALSQREVLLREVYHRVRNNLQIVETLLYLRGARLESAEARTALADVSRRVHALALVHQQLMQSDDLARFSVKPFLEEVCGAVAAGGPSDRAAVEVRADIEPVPVGIEFATPLGLLAMELLTHAVQRAAAAGAGAVEVSLRRRDPRTLVLVVEGPAPAEGSTAEAWDARMVRALAGQLDATLETDEPRTGTDRRRAVAIIPHESAPA